MKAAYAAMLALTIATSGAAGGQQVRDSTSVSSPAGGRAHDDADIEHIMAAFHSAVVAHDGQQVAALSVTEGSTWFNVLSDKAFADAHAKSPSVQKVRHSSFADFAKFVSSNPSALNPQHTNVHIHTDGTIATVYFDYVFLIDGKLQNHGCETWQLIKAADGWKIAAISYSSDPNV